MREPVVTPYTLILREEERHWDVSISSTLVTSILLPFAL